MRENLIKNMFKFALFFVAATVIFTACEKDDDDDDIPDIPAEDGVYVTGPATGFDGLVLEGMMDPGREEGAEFASNPRSGMFEKFLYLSAGNFNIVEKSGATELNYGFKAGTVETFDKEGDGDETDGPVTTGEFEDGGAAFNAESSGFYHVILDKPTGRVWFTKINHWAVMGDATDLGWSAENPMTQVSLTATEAEWEITELTMRERGGFKFRYNDGWKITTDDFIIFANIGKGATDTEFIMGGGTFSYPDDGEGAYTVTLSWSISDGFSYSTERTGDVEPLPEYPEELYMIGSALNPEDSDGDGTPDGWQWDLTDAPMVPSHSKPHLFWKIVWLHEDEFFKFAPQRDWIGDFGKDGDGEEGVFDIGGENLPVPGETGYYMVVVNLETEQVAVVEPIVNLFGDVVDWTSEMFTVDNENEVITITRDMLAGSVRMYAWFDAVEDWFTDWWQHEFIILEGEIVFRGTGDDQERVNLPAGTATIDLNFRTGEGTITQE